MNDQFLAGPGSDEPDEDPSLLADRAQMIASLTHIQKAFFTAKSHAQSGVSIAGLQLIVDDLVAMDSQLHEIHQELSEIHGEGWESMLGIAQENYELERFFDHVRETAEHYELEGFGDDPEPDDEIGGAIPLTSIPPSAVIHAGLSSVAVPGAVTSANVAINSAASAQISATQAALAGISASTASTLPTQSQYDLLKAGYNSMKADFEVARHEHLTTSITATIRLEGLVRAGRADSYVTRKTGWVWITAAILTFILCVWVTHGDGWGYGTVTTLIASVCFLVAGLAAFYTASLKLKALMPAREAADDFQKVTDHLTKELGI